MGRNCCAGSETADARLIALDAKTGEECAGFGQYGSVDLKANMPDFYPGSCYSTSPPVIGGGLIVIRPANRRLHAVVKFAGSGVEGCRDVKKVAHRLHVASIVPHI